MELKKSYKGFVIWMIAFIIITIGITFLPVSDAAIMARIVDNISTFGVAVLAFMIYKTENIYWYTGVSFEEAQKAGSERRKKYAWNHFKRFGLFSLGFCLFSIIAQILHMGIWIDIVALTAGLVMVAVSTMKFKL